MNSVKTVSRELVKPSTPTPPHLKSYKLSFIDELLPLMEVGVLLFYTPKPSTVDLKQSLAKVLSSFYPLAGRFILDDHIVDCGDQGAEFLEAEAPDSELSVLSTERDLENLHGFLPRKNHQESLATYPILSIKVTNLKCGGLAIGISISHKIFDVSALSTFVAAWSNASGLDPEKMAIDPTFEGSSLFPSKNRDINPSSKTMRFLDMQRISVKRFSFDKEAIAGLRSNAGMSKVRVVCAVITRALILVDRKKRGGRSRDCLITQAVNIRGRTVPPLHKHACGNLVLLSLAQYCSSTGGIGTETEPAVQELADLLGDATSRSVSACSDMLRLDEDRRNEMLMTPLRTAGATFLSGESNVVTLTDYSKFGFYEADFGWGKPVSAGIAPHTIANTVVLMGNKDGDGIEAWVHLEKNDMCLFGEEIDN